MVIKIILGIIGVCLVRLLAARRPQNDSLPGWFLFFTKGRFLCCFLFLYVCGAS
jgi:hypothetical protein